MESPGPMLLWPGYRGPLPRDVAVKRLSGLGNQKAKSSPPSFQTLQK